MKIIIFFIIIIAALGGWLLVSRSSDQELVARNGLHWHANLSINIFGENQDIPPGIGLAGLPHKPLHTHDRDNVIHLEFSGMVRKDDIKLGSFFEVWGKTFNQDCIFDKCSGEQGQLKILVNGKENSEFANYIMRDGDKIEIVFE